MASGTIRQAIYSDTYNYIKFNEGILIQRGVLSGFKSGDTLTYPIPFTVAPHMYITPIYNTRSTVICVYSYAGNNAASCRIYAFDMSTQEQSTSTTLNVDWLAIGYWK